MIQTLEMRHRKFALNLSVERPGLGAIPGAHFRGLGRSTERFTLPNGQQNSQKLEC